MTRDEIRLVKAVLKWVKYELFEREEDRQMKSKNVSLQARALSWFDGLAITQREDLLREAGRSYFTFDELIEQYVLWLELRILAYEKIMAGK